MLTCVNAHELAVAQGIPEAFEPGRRRLVDVEKRTGEDGGEADDGQQAFHSVVSSAITDFTNASSSSREPLFLNDQSARSTFSRSEISRASRSSVATSERIR